MNSQKRNVDVWLIYRCMECDSTYNLTILSRTKPELIRKDLFIKFSENCESLAWEYAFSSEAARKNGVEQDYSNVEYDILHDNISVNDILNADVDIIAFKIKTRFDFGLKLFPVIRQCLSLSANQLNKMVELKAIFTPEDYSLRKHKIKNGDIVLVSKDKLHAIYK